MVHNDKQRAIWEMFCNFKGHLFDDGESSKKTFFHAIYALDMFETLRKTLLIDYEIATFKGKPAIELGFRVRIGNAGFLYRGFVDLVLRNKKTGALLVLEVKTTKNQAAEANYVNSGQGLGYSIFTREIDENTDHFDVLYLVYEASAARFVPMRFTKHHTERALWIQDLIADCQIMQVYDQFDVWPRHGESCYNWYRECHWLGMCHMTTARLLGNNEPDAEDKEKAKKKEEVFDFELHLADLLQTQLKDTGATA